MNGPYQARQAEGFDNVLLAFQRKGPNAAFVLGISVGGVA